MLSNNDPSTTPYLAASPAIANPQPQATRPLPRHNLNHCFFRPPKLFQRSTPIRLCLMSRWKELEFHRRRDKQDRHGQKLSLSQNTRKWQGMATRLRTVVTRAATLQ